ncbi:MAG: aspartate kinase [Candidatus Hydrothermales bacterium]
MIKILKFGGEVLKNIRKIKFATLEVEKEIKNGTKPVIVVSAMGNTTDELLKLSEKITKNPDKRELDMLLSAGERIAMALFSLSLRERNINSRSLTGSQAGILTDSKHSSAHILEIRGKRILETMEKGQIPIIAGFQGVSTEKEITTLGRGGSDLTAAALAVFLKAKDVIFYKDVDGIYALPPKIIKNSKRIKKISFEEMLFLSEYGAEVLNPRAVALGMKHNLKFYIKKMNSNNFTLIENEAIETPYVKAIVIKKGLSVILLEKVKENMNIPQIAKFLNENNINVLFFTHGIRKEKGVDLTFAVETKNKIHKKIINEIENIYKPFKIKIIKNMGTLTLVGYGIGDSPLILEKSLEELEKIGIHVYAIFSSKPGIILLLKEENLIRALKALSKKWNLTS